MDLGLPDALLFRTLWDTAEMEKRAGRMEAAIAILQDLAESPNPYRARALEALARHYEHGARDCRKALELTLAALGLLETAPLRRREARLRKRIGRMERLPGT